MRPGKWRSDSTPNPFPDSCIGSAGAVVRDCRPDRLCAETQTNDLPGQLEKIQALARLSDRMAR